MRLSAARCPVCKASDIEIESATRIRSVMSDFMKEASQNNLRENRNPNRNEKINIYIETEININLKRDIFKVRCTSRRPTLGGRDKQKTRQTLTELQQILHLQISKAIILQRIIRAASRKNRKTTRTILRGESIAFNAALPCESEQLNTGAKVLF